ncbi:MAG TPA: hypothetical protein VFF27_10025 [Bacteroidia bacterium]|jgi:hypothetical protein|nr:hypothetical protein [Bacteroidia bacterium]
MSTIDQFNTFQKFSEPTEALDLLELLKANNINGLFDDNSTSFDPTFSASQLTKEYRVKLLKKDFEPARKLLLTLYASQLENADPNHYLFSFTDEELIEIIHKQNEWSYFDFLLAQKILKDRGKDVSPEQIETLWKERIKELSTPENKQTGWIIVGYLFALTGGLLGIFIGWYLSRHKKTLPDGNVVFAYSASDRKHGYFIFLIGIVSFFVWVVYKLSQMN